jgi:hypothetical protein
MFGLFPFSFIVQKCSHQKRSHDNNFLVFISLKNLWQQFGASLCRRQGKCVPRGISSVSLPCSEALHVLEVGDHHTKQLVAPPCAQQQPRHPTISQAVRGSMSDANAHDMHQHKCLCLFRAGQGQGTHTTRVCAFVCRAMNGWNLR